MSFCHKLLLPKPLRCCHHASARILVFLRKSGQQVLRPADKAVTGVSRCQGNSSFDTDGEVLRLWPDSWPSLNRINPNYRHRPETQRLQSCCPQPCPPPPPNPDLCEGVQCVKRLQTVLTPRGRWILSSPVCPCVRPSVCLGGLAARVWVACEEEKETKWREIFFFSLPGMIFHSAIESLMSVR